MHTHYFFDIIKFRLVGVRVSEKIPSIFLLYASYALVPDAGVIFLKLFLWIRDNLLFFLNTRKIICLSQTSTFYTNFNLIWTLCEKILDSLPLSQILCIVCFDIFDVLAALVIAPRFSLLLIDIVSRCW